MIRSAAFLAALAAACIGACSAPAPRHSPATTTADRSSPPAGPDAPGAAELDLLSQVNAYRETHGLTPLRLSRSLSNVARLHALDLSAHGFSDACNIHSWSKSGPWSPCCYRPDHSESRCMWNKPRELTSYEGIGYEIAYWFSAGVRAGRVLDTWRASPVHDAVLRNAGTWSKRTWRAVGLAVHGNYAVAWFGEDVDPAGYWD